MASSLIGVLIAEVGLVPEKISAIGIEFTAANQQALITLLVAAIAYFTVSFLVYVYSELTAWQVVVASKELEELKEAINSNEVVAFGTVDTDRFKGHLKFLHFKTRPTFFIRLAIELAIPLAFSVYSSHALLSANLAEAALS